MSKVNNNKTNSFDPIRANRQSGDAKQTGKNEIQSAIGKLNGGDKLEFSGRAADAGKLLEQLKNLPDARQEKIETLRGQIAAGEYDPTSETIADAILKDEQND